MPRVSHAVALSMIKSTIKVLRGFGLHDRPQIFYIFLVSLISRLIFIIYLHPRIPSHFAPDEGTYSSLVAWILQGNNVAYFPDFGPDLYYRSQSFILPGVFLAELGIESLTAIRLVSAIYGSLGIIVFWMVTKKVISITRNEIVISKQMIKRLNFFTAIYAFWPSNFLWSTLGLRETTSTFWILVSTLFFLKLTQTSNTSLDSKMAIAIRSIIFAMALSFSVTGRPQVGFLFGGVLIITILLSSLKRISLILVLIPLSLGLILGNQFMNSTNKAETLIKPKSQQETAKSEIYDLTVKKILSIREGNRIGALSALPPSACNEDSLKSEQLLICLVKEFPSRLFAILLRPIPILDSGSSSNNLAALENCLWFLLFVFFAKNVYHLSSARFAQFLTPFYLYIALFVTLSVYYEGNLGTAFRHKASILWPILLVLAVSQTATSIRCRSLVRIRTKKCS